MTGMMLHRKTDTTAFDMGRALATGVADIFHGLALGGRGENLGWNGRSPRRGLPRR